MSQLMHTAGSDTIFIQIYMDALQGLPGVSKSQISLQIKDCPKKAQTLKNRQN